MDGESGPAAETGAQFLQDAQLFRQWLQSGPGERGLDAAAGVTSPLSAALTSAHDALRQREADFFRTLERAALTGDPVEGLAVQRRLSELHLDHGLAVKVIAKTAQALESLTRMQ
jgi:hypothetical protein